MSLIFCVHIGQNANESLRPWYRVVVAIWIIVGLTWFTMVVCVALSITGDSKTKTVKIKQKKPVVELKVFIPFLLKIRLI